MKSDRRPEPIPAEMGLPLNLAEAALARAGGKGPLPGWAPLFLNAGGLVMELGGVMAYGSVVACEHGIPAVEGTTPLAA